MPQCIHVSVGFRAEIKMLKICMTKSEQVREKHVQIYLIIFVHHIVDVKLMHLVHINPSNWAKCFKIHKNRRHLRMKMHMVDCTFCEGKTEMQHITSFHCVTAANRLFSRSSSNDREKKRE